MSSRMSVIWLDANGSTRQTIIRTNTGASGVITAASSLSNAAVSESWEGTDVFTGLTGVAATYQSVADQASLAYTDGSGNVVYITLPAPLASIFLADGETVDPTQIAALTAQVVGTVLTTPGNVVTAYLGGFRRRLTKEYQ